MRRRSRTPPVATDGWRFWDPDCLPKQSRDSNSKRPTYQVVNTLRSKILPRNSRSSLRPALRPRTLVTFGAISDHLESRILECHGLSVDVAVRSVAMHQVVVSTVVMLYLNPVLVTRVADPVANR